MKLKIKQNVEYKILCTEDVEIEFDLNEEELFEQVKDLSIHQWKNWYCLPGNTIREDVKRYLNDYIQELDNDVYEEIFAELSNKYPKKDVEIETWNGTEIIDEKIEPLIVKIAEIVAPHYREEEEIEEEETDNETDEEPVCYHFHENGKYCSQCGEKLK